MVFLPFQHTQLWNDQTPLGRTQLLLSPFMCIIFMRLLWGQRDHFILPHLVDFFKSFPEFTENCVLYIKMVFYLFQVLLEIQKELLEYKGTGISVLGKICFWILWMTKFQRELLLRGMLSVAGEGIGLLFFLCLGSTFNLGFEHSALACWGWSVVPEPISPVP